MIHFLADTLKTLSWSIICKEKSTHIYASSTVRLRTEHPSTVSTRLRSTYMWPTEGRVLSSEHHPQPAPRAATSLPPNSTDRSSLLHTLHRWTHTVQSSGCGFCSLEGHPCHHSARVFNLFIPIAVRYSTVKTPLFTHFIVDRHLGFHFQFGAVINSPCTHIYYRLLIHAAKLFLWRYRNLHSCP